MYRFVLIIDCKTLSPFEAMPMLSNLLEATADRLNAVALQPAQYATLTDANGVDIGSMYLLEKEQENDVRFIPAN